MTISGKRTINAGAPTNLNALPLTDAFKQDIFKNEYRWQTLTPALCAEHLSNKNLDVALIPSLSYSAIRRIHTLIIIPDIALSCSKKSQSTFLLFNRGLSDIGSVAVDERSPAETALLKIILKEKFGTEPSFIPAPPDYRAMLEHADAALITGDEALLLNESFEQKLDLGEEWDDLTDGLPFVSAFWAGHKNIMENSVAEDFIRAKKEGIHYLDQIAGKFAERLAKSISSETLKNYLSQNTGYDFGKNEKNGLMEFYSYCYYYGLIDEIPELYFVSE